VDVNTLYFTLEKRYTAQKEMFHQIDVQRKSPEGWVSLVKPEKYTARAPRGKEKGLYFSEGFRISKEKGKEIEMVKWKRRNSI
jgi:hypothetical protein